MGILNRKKNDEEFLTILAEIRDNLNKDDELKILESKIADAHYSNDEELGVWTNRLVELENKHIELNKGVGALVKNYANLSNKVNDYEGIINNLQDLVEKQDEKIETLLDVTHGLLEICKNKNIKDKPVKPKTDKKLIRTYSEGIVNTMPKIKEMKPNGQFVLKSGKIAGYDINTILRLKKLITTDSSFIKIGEKIGLSNSTISRVCCAIEYGLFDKYINEWEQIQMKKHYRNWKPNIENNPEKRKEKGYC